MALADKICPKCDGPKNLTAMLCLSCRLEERRKGQSRLCPDCGNVKTPISARCLACAKALKTANKSVRSWGEAEVVRTDDLARVIEKWQTMWNGDRDPEEHIQTFGAGNNQRAVLSADAYLCEHAKVPNRRIWGIIHRETKHTSLTIAEQILMAMDREYMLTNGEVEVLRNPRWSLETWMTYMAERGCV